MVVVVVVVIVVAVVVVVVVVDVVIIFDVGVLLQFLLSRIVTLVTFFDIVYQ